MADEAIAAELLLRADAGAVTRAWGDLFRANLEQAERLRETELAADYWAPPPGSKLPLFTFDPSKPPIEAESLRPLAEPDEVWLDIGAGIGRAALALAPDVREMRAQDPSPGMTEALRANVEASGAKNVAVLPASDWPPSEPPAAVDVCFATHVTYFVEDIAGFLDAMERCARRMCAIVSTELGTVWQPSSELFEDVHGEPFARGPALRELLALLSARGHVFNIQTWANSAIPATDVDVVHRRIRGWYLVSEGSEKDAVLRRRLVERYDVGDGKVVLPRVIGSHTATISWAVDG